MQKDIVKQLFADHQRIRSIFESFKKGDRKYRKEGLGILRREFVPHIKAEEQVFFPLCERNKKIPNRIHECREFHELAEKTLNELESSEKNWFARLMVLRELTEHHFQAEERFFSEIKEHIEHDSHSHATARLLKAKKFALGRMF